MKKMTTTITENGKTKTISVWLDERTVKALEQVNDDEFTSRYIIDEYKSSLVERKETRRHTSLESCNELKDEHCYEDDVFMGMDVEILHRALLSLTEEQRELIRRVYYNDEKQTDIAIELGIDKTSVRDRLKTAYKKILTFFEN